ncbi:MAG: copper-binding protein [Acidobacteria bacterium]|nr:copper-binding protein [Acidobacteriota bacterium]
MAKYLFGVAVACISLAACSPQKQAETSAPPAESQQQEETKRYELNGKVVSIDSSGKQVTVDHEAIPGFMEAMAMPYTVKDLGSLANLKTGDQITAQVVVSKDGVVLDDIKVLTKDPQK